MKLVRVLLIVLSLSRICLGQSLQSPRQAPTRTAPALAAPRDIAQAAFKSVVLLEMNDSNGQPLSLGSGFYVSNGIVATNAHVIEGAYSGTARVVGGSNGLQILGTIAFDGHSDLALLKVNGSAPSLHLGLSTDPVVGDQVYVVGNPLGLEGTFSEGIVSGVRHLDADSILQMTAPISPGSSGGPVMDSTGAVIGIAEATFSNGQNLNLAVPVSYLSRLMNSVSAETPITPLSVQANINSHSKSVVDGLGERDTSGVVASGFEFTHVSQEGLAPAGYELRLTNRLPVPVTSIRMRIIYYDASKAVMDFEEFFYSGTVPPGLTKIVDSKSETMEAGRAAFYYHEHGEDGREIQCASVEGSWEVRCTSSMSPKVELRIVGFDEDAAQ
ncbi:MAG: S1C family serine protease [Terracidiphilus sp.]